MDGSVGAPSDPPAAASLSVYQLIKDLGFPIVVTLILLFQFSPKLDTLIMSSQHVESQMAAVTAYCIGKSP
jgi:hypothetical protein